jgi:hypothetical protein
MRAGIALDFRREIGQVDVLMSQQNGVGEVVTVLDAKCNIIFYMIAKERHFHKPRKQFEKSFKNNYLRALKGLKQACIDYKINKFAIPRLGFNLDMLSWSEFIKLAILDIFGDLDIHILFCNSRPGIQRVQTHQSSTSSQSKEALSTSSVTKVLASRGDTSQQCPSTAAPSVVELPANDVSPAPLHPGEHMPHTPTVNAQIPPAEEVLVLSRGPDSKADLTTSASNNAVTNTQSKVPASHGRTLQQCPSTAAPSVVELLAIDVFPAPQHPGELGPRPPTNYVQCSPVEEGADLSRGPKSKAKKPQV